jgi:hypothetical protein
MKHDVMISVFVNGIEAGDEEQAEQIAQDVLDWDKLDKTCKAHGWVCQSDVTCVDPEEPEE